MLTCTLPYLDVRYYHIWAYFEGPAVSWSGHVGVFKILVLKLCRDWFVSGTLLCDWLPGFVAGDCYTYEIHTGLWDDSDCTDPIL